MTTRQERFEQLRAEIDELAARYAELPPGSLQSICQSEIDQRLREIDQLNVEQRAEEMDWEDEEEPRLRMPNFPAIGISMFVIAVGMIASVSLLIVAGAIGLIASLGPSPGRGRERKSPPPRVPGERFQWRP